MVSNIVKAALILRNDLAATWAIKNPILAKGEIGAEIDTGLLKIGDGSTPFNDLNYINDGSVSLDLTNYIKKPSTFTNGNIPIFNNNGALVDSEVSIDNVNQLTIATYHQVGSVKASQLDNYINVDANGYMSVNRVATDKLYVPDNSEFILNGGSA